MDNTTFNLVIILLIIYMMQLLFFIIFSKKIMQKFMDSVNNKQNEYKNELKSQNDILAKQLVDQISSHNLSNHIDNGMLSKKDLMNIFVKLRESIKDSCVKTMNKIGADRIAIYLFHNGTRSTHGISFFKMSCMCEKINIGSGVRERMMEHSNIPVNLFDDMIEKLIYNNRYIIINNEDLKDATHKMFISSDKINYTQLVAIYDINNNILGFIAVEMDKLYSKEEADKEKEILDELVKQLIPVLSYADYSSIKTT